METPILNLWTESLYSNINLYHIRYISIFLFTFLLLKELSGMGIAGTGTVRQNRLNKVPIKTKKELEKKTVQKGFCTSVYNTDQVLTV